MRNIRTLLLGIIALTISSFILTSCEDSNNPLKTTINYAPADMTFSLDSLNYLASLKTESLLYSDTLNVNIDSILEAHNISNLATLSEAGVDTVSVSIVQPTTVTLTWITSSRLTVQIPGQSEVTIAHTASINPLTRTILFVVDDASVLPYLNNHTFVVKVYGNIVPPLPVNQIQMLMHLGFTLDVNVL